MRRIFFLLIALTGMTMQSMAQDGEVPPIKKFVKVTASGVNLRKTPNASSPRLIFQNNLSDECMDCEPSLVWSSKPLKKGDEAARASVLPIIGESGDWYYVYFFQSLYGDEGYSEKAYIMKKFCTDVELRPLTLPAPENLNIVRVTSGKHKDICIEKLYGYMDRQLLRIGKYQDGKFVFTHSVGFEMNEDGNATSFGKDADGDDVVRLGKNLFDEWQLDLNKLAASSNTLDAIVNNPSKLTQDDIMYYGIEGDNKWYVIR